MSTSPTVGSLTERLIRRFRFPESLGTLWDLFNFSRISQALEVPSCDCLSLSSWMDTLQVWLQFRFIPYGHPYRITQILPWISSLDFRSSIGDFSPGGLKYSNQIKMVESQPL